MENFIFCAVRKTVLVHIAIKKPPKLSSSANFRSQTNLTVIKTLHHFAPRAPTGVLQLSSSCLKLLLHLYTAAQKYFLH